MFKLFKVKSAKIRKWGINKSSEVVADKQKRLFSYFTTTEPKATKAAFILHACCLFLFLLPMIAVNGENYLSSKIKAELQ